MNGKVEIGWCNSCKMFHMKCPSCLKEISFKREDLQKILEKAKEK